MEVLNDLLHALRRCFEGFPDKRRGLNTRYTMADIGMSAFSVFFMTSPSFLEHQRRFEEGHHRSNCQTLFGITQIPRDNHVRDMLDAAAPERLHPVFADVVDALKACPGGFDSFRRLDGQVLIALDGTEYHASNKVHCPQCSHRRRGKAGELEYFHAMLAATLVAPGHDKVIPLPPEFIVPQDGAQKQDCESAAAKRWLATHGSHYADLAPVYLGDDLFSRQPMCEAVLAQGASFIFVCKPSSHRLIEEYLTGGTPEGLEHKIKRGKQQGLQRYRWLAGAPLRDGKDALSVNWFEMTILNAKGEVTYRNSWVGLSGFLCMGGIIWKKRRRAMPPIHRNPDSPPKSSDSQVEVIPRGLACGIPGKRPTRTLRQFTNGLCKELKPGYRHKRIARPPPLTPSFPHR